MELKFVKLKLHCKLKFHKLKFLESDKFLIISQIIVDPYTFYH